MFNVLSEFDPAYAEEVRGTPLDPFYLDDRVRPLLDALKERWGAR